MPTISSDYLDPFLVLLTLSSSSLSLSLLLAALNTQTHANANTLKPLEGIDRISAAFPVSSSYCSCVRVRALLCNLLLTRTYRSFIQSNVSHFLVYLTSTRLTSTSTTRAISFTTHAYKSTQLVVKIFLVLFFFFVVVVKLSERINAMCAPPHSYQRKRE